MRLLSLFLVTFVLGFASMTFAEDFLSAPEETIKAAATQNAEGIKAFNNGDWDSAKSYFKKAISIDPEFAEAYFNLGLVLHETNFHIKSIEYFELAQKYGSENPAITFSNLVELHLNVRDSDLKEGPLPALEGTDNAAAEQNAEGIKAYNRGDFDSAKSHFREALKIDRYFAEAHFNLGLVLHDIKSHVKGARHMEWAKKYGSKNPAIMESVSIEKHLNLLRVVPRDDVVYAPKGIDKTAAMHNDKGVKAFNREDFASAKVLFRKALSIDPKFAEANFNLGITLHETDKHKLSRKYFKKAKKYGSKNPAIKNSRLMKHHTRSRLVGK